MINQKNSVDDKKILIGQPLDYPYELVSAMKFFFDSTKEIKKAYLACIQYPDPKISPKILIALDTNINLKK